MKECVWKFSKYFFTLAFACFFSDPLSFICKEQKGEKNPCKEKLLDHISCYQIVTICSSLMTYFTVKNNTFPDSHY